MVENKKHRQSLKTHAFLKGKLNWSNFFIQKFWMCLVESKNWKKRKNVLD